MQQEEKNRVGLSRHEQSGDTIRSSSSLWSTFKDEIKVENLSLNFERNSYFCKKDPEEVLEYFHSSIVNFHLFILILPAYVKKIN